MPAPSPRARAQFASDPTRSRGRVHAEPESPSRTVFQRDRDRVVHCDAFRRLKDKTQVFIYDEGDHYRTRLTHTLEVSQIARSLARSLGLAEDLAEALALAHDLGHPPFGHAGERALAAEMTDFGGFDHNAQSLRVVTELERRYPGFDGLNLTWETLEGLVKHNGPLVDARGRPVGPHAGGELPYTVVAFNQVRDLELASHAGPEAQIAALSDDIAYDAHDIDDGLRAGLLDLDDLREIDFLDEIIRDILRQYPGLAGERVRAELIRRLISAMIADVVDETAGRLGELTPVSVADIRAASRPVVAFGAEMASHEAAIKARLTARVYRHRRVVGVMSAAERLVRRLFRHFLADPSLMPLDWQSDDRGDHTGKARRIADFIAGMTDRYAIAEYERLFGEAPDLG